MAGADRATAPGDIRTAASGVVRAAAIGSACAAAPGGFTPRPAGRTPTLWCWDGLVPGRLIRRYQRFLADVELEDGGRITAHCPNSGSMLGCDRPGARVYLSRNGEPRRRTAFTWEMIRVGRVWVGINTHHANRLVNAALEQRLIPAVGGYDRVRREVRWGSRSRFDFLLEGAREDCFVEVKNVTLAAGGVAAFPDAVTLRGRKHLEDLARLVCLRRRKPARAVILYIVQRSDAAVLRPAEEIDPEYAAALRRAVARGVTPLVIRTRVTPKGTERLAPGRLILD
ncbi:MAG: DNA/RNA nuclease SfsA [Candidatus Eisenbacteria bacterium]|nr:DNA/RNA nuclease SfsA [Candidatus Eisenbacteria bacterium]